VTISNLLEVLYALKEANGDLPIYAEGRTRDGFFMASLIKGARISEGPGPSEDNRPFVLLAGDFPNRRAPIAINETPIPPAATECKQPTFDAETAIRAAEKLPVLDLKWPDKMQSQWWRWFESLWALAGTQKAVSCSALLAAWNMARDALTAVADAAKKCGHPEFAREAGTVADALESRITALRNIAEVG
jgi:hypothetical protein